MNLKDQINHEFARVTQLGVVSATPQLIAIDIPTGRYIVYGRVRK